jgi:hypothetical protein
MTEFYQAFGVCFGSVCCLLGVWHGIRPALIEEEKETVTTWERVEYKEEEIEVNHELNIEL